MLEPETVVLGCVLEEVGRLLQYIVRLCRFGLRAMCLSFELGCLLRVVELRWHPSRIAGFRSRECRLVGCG